MPYKIAKDFVQVSKQSFQQRNKMFLDNATVSANYVVVISHAIFGLDIYLLISNVYYNKIWSTVGSQNIRFCTNIYLLQLMCIIYLTPYAVMFFCVQSWQIPNSRSKQSKNSPGLPFEPLILLIICLLITAYALRGQRTVCQHSGITNYFSP